MPNLSTTKEPVIPAARKVPLDGVVVLKKEMTSPIPETKIVSARGGALASTKSSAL